jgi:hypothetical protein
LLRSVIAVVAGKVADDGVVLLFDVAVVVLAVGTTAGEGDVFILAVLPEVFVDELAAVIVVNAQKGKREMGAARLDGFKNIATGHIFRDFRLGPGSGHIGACAATIRTPPRNAPARPCRFRSTWRIF